MAQGSTTLHTTTPSPMQLVASMADRHIPTPSGQGHVNDNHGVASYQRYASYVHQAPEPFASLAKSGDWSSGLCDWFAQPGGLNMCCLAMWCPCVQYGMIVEQLPREAVTCGGNPSGACGLFCVLGIIGGALTALLDPKLAGLPLTAMLHCMTRGHIRQKYGILPQLHPLHDFFVTWCCAPCALCQEARELVVRGAEERTGALTSSRAGSTNSDPGAPMYYVMAPRYSHGYSHPDGPASAAPDGVATGVPVFASHPPPTHVATLTLLDAPTAIASGGILKQAPSLVAHGSAKQEAAQQQPPQQQQVALLHSASSGGGAVVGAPASRAQSIADDGRQGSPARACSAPAAGTDAVAASSATPSSSASPRKSKKAS